MVDCTNVDGRRSCQFGYLLRSCLKLFLWEKLYWTMNWWLVHENKIFDEKRTTMTGALSLMLMSTLHATTFHAISFLSNFPRRRWDWSFVILFKNRCFLVCDSFKILQPLAVCARTSERRHFKFSHNQPIICTVQICPFRSFSEELNVVLDSSTMDWDWYTSTTLVHNMTYSMIVQKQTTILFSTQNYPRTT